MHTLYMRIWMCIAICMLGISCLYYMRRQSKTVSFSSDLVQKIALLIIRILGWKIYNITLPSACNKGVVVLAPHTSNWDFFYGMLFKFSCPTIVVRFAIKKEVMFFPLSYIMKFLGAIPINRHAIRPNQGVNMVATMTHMLNESSKLLLLIAPEGTRSYAKRWKTGFYRIAASAQVPIILGYMNYAKKEMGLGPIFEPTGSIEKDIETIKDFYRSIPGKYPMQGII